MEQTDGRTLDRFVDPALHTVRAVSCYDDDITRRSRCYVLLIFGERFRTVARTHAQMDGQPENRMFPARSAVLAETQ